DAPRKPTHEILRVARNNDSGSKTIRQTQNAASAAIQTYPTILSETQRTPLIQSANKNPKARIAAIPRKTLPATLRAECCPSLTESFDGMSFSRVSRRASSLDNWLFCSTPHKIAPRCRYRFCASWSLCPQPGICCFAPNICSSPPFGNRAEG